MGRERQKGEGDSGKNWGMGKKMRGGEGRKGTVEKRGSSQFGNCDRKKKEQPV